MKYFNLYRVATYLLILFCLTHTFGGLLAEHSNGVAPDAVWAAMKAVRFDFMGMTVSFQGMYLGFGLMLSVFLLFAAAVAWHLGGVPLEESASLSPISRALTLSLLATAVLSWKYFFVGPGVMASLITLLLGIASLRATSVDRRVATTR